MTAYNAAPIRFAGVSMVTATLGVNDPQIGDRCSDSGIDYVFIYNNGGSQASIHLGMIATAVTSYSLTVSSVTDVDTLMGVVVNTTIPTSSYGWIAVKGFVTVAFAGTSSGAVGGYLSLGADGAFGTRSPTSTSSPNPHDYGKLMSAIASGGSGGVWLNVF